MARSVSVQVVVNGEVETLSVRVDQTSDEVLRNIIAVRALEKDVKYKLFHSNSGSWLEDGQSMKAVGEGDFLEVKKDSEVGKLLVVVAAPGSKWASDKIHPVAMFHKVAKKTILSYADPLRKSVPVLQQLLGLKGKEEYAFKKIVVKDADRVEGITHPPLKEIENVLFFPVIDDLNANLSLLEHGISRDAKILLFPLQLLQEVVKKNLFFGANAICSYRR